MHRKVSPAAVAYPAPRHFIGGRWIASGETAVPVINPATGAVLDELRCVSSEDVSQAAESANRAFSQWQKAAPAVRASLLSKTAALLRDRASEISAVVALELGKPVAEGLTEIELAASIIDWYAAEGIRAYGRVVPGSSNLRQVVVREPMGVVAAFTPWNGPVASPARKISAALASGCTVVIKPSEETPSSAMLLVQCFEEAGVPEGVINVVFGHPSAISAQLIESPYVRCVTLTGSTAVGRLLAEAAGRRLKPAIMELGGHAPVVVCEDADPGSVARLAVRAKYRNSGQICFSPTRFFVHQSIYAAFVDEFVREASAWRVGDPFDIGTQMGPLANERRRESIHALVGDALCNGAVLAAGGRAREGSGFFYEPTVLIDVPASAAAMQVEPFGPVALINSFHSLEEACRRANETPFGLAAFAFSDSARALATISTELRAGLVSINHFGGLNPAVPFGGLDYSGYGREGGTESFDGYMRTKVISHQHA